MWETHRQLWTRIDPTHDEHAKIFLDALLQNNRDAHSSSLKAFYGFLALLAMHGLLQISAADELEILSVTVRDLSLVRSVVPLVATFTLYQALLQTFFGLRLRHAIFEYFRKNLPPVSELEYTGVVDVPSFFNIERFLAENAGLTGRWSAHVFGYLWVVALLILSLFGAAAALWSGWESVPAVGLVRWAAIGSLAVGTLTLIRCVILVASELSMWGEPGGDALSNAAAA